MRCSRCTCDFPNPRGLWFLCQACRGVLTRATRQRYRAAAEAVWTFRRRVSRADADLPDALLEEMVVAWFQALAEVRGR